MFCHLRLIFELALGFDSLLQLPLFAGLFSDVVSELRFPSPANHITQRQLWCYYRNLLLNLYMVFMYE